LAEVSAVPGAEVAPDAWSADEFGRRARARLDFALPADLFEEGAAHGGDHRLDGRPMWAGAPRGAAVLVPIVAHGDGATVLLTTRLTGLRQHSGQVAFPGGKIDPDDGSPIEAALREAEEEIGLPRDRVTPLGYLDPYLTGTGYMVVPVVAMVVPPLRLAINPHEVADAFEVPLRFLMDPLNHQQQSREFSGRLRRFYAMPFGERLIWGATAGMLRVLYERLYG
jgi:8-oxo-dGTP pyrophosphatase MutT (NUDIX family)